MRKFVTNALILIGGFFLICMVVDAVSGPSSVECTGNLYYTSCVAK